MFKSEILLKRVKREIKKAAPKAKFILPKDKAVLGAVRLAIKEIS